MKKVLFFLCACAMVVVLSSCGGGVDKSDPKSVMEAYFDCAQKGDLDGIVELMDLKDDTQKDTYKGLLKLGEDEMKKISRLDKVYVYDFGEKDKYHVDEYLDLVCANMDLAMFSFPYVSEEVIQKFAEKIMSHFENERITAETRKAFEQAGYANTTPARTPLETLEGNA